MNSKRKPSKLDLEKALRKNLRKRKMRLMLMITDPERYLIIEALSNHAKMLSKKNSTQENKKQKSIENIIQQLAFGRDHDKK